MTALVLAAMFLLAVLVGAMTAVAVVTRRDNRTTPAEQADRAKRDAAWDAEFTDTPIFAQLSEDRMAADLAAWESEGEQ